MKLETVIKLIKANTNFFGFVNAKKLKQELESQAELKELRIAIVKEPNCDTPTKEILNTVIIPIAKAKDLLYKKAVDDVIYVYARSIVKLRIVDRACTLINSRLAGEYKFQLITNYDCISEAQNEIT